MHRARVLIGAVAVALAACVAPAHASNYGIELNGTYRVTSNGDWAKTNDVFIDEPTVVQTWTVSSSCTNPTECTGEVRSDQGWSAPIRYVGFYWIVDREVPNWEPCPDGTAAAGFQKFTFWGLSDTGIVDMKNLQMLAGRDVTIGPSGACGINKPLVIQLPLRMERLS